MCSYNFLVRLRFNAHTPKRIILLIYVFLDAESKSENDFWQSPIVFKIFNLQVSNNLLWEKINSCVILHIYSIFFLINFALPLQGAPLFQAPLGKDCMSLVHEIQKTGGRAACTSNSQHYFLFMYLALPLLSVLPPKTPTCWVYIPLPYEPRKTCGCAACTLTSRHYLPLQEINENFIVEYLKEQKQAPKTVLRFRFYFEKYTD